MPSPILHAPRDGPDTDEHLVPYLPGCTAFSKASCRTGSYFNPCWTDQYTNNKVSSQLVEIHHINLGALADLVDQRWTFFLARIIAVG
jgi:hypothetical protein